MKRHFACAVFICTCFAAATHAATPEQIRSSITKAKAFLYTQQNKDKNWEQPIEMHGDQATGQTALAVYALLASGESHQDPRLAPAIEYLKKTPTTGVYALGLRCQVWLHVPPTPDVRAAVSRDAKTLLGGLKRTGEGKGFYDYNPGGRSAYSHSRSQYAVLGMWAASQMGIEVPREYWQIVEKAWIEDQDPSGGWAYYAKPRDEYPITPGMTAVGVATLFITQDYLHAAEGLNCGGNVHNPAIERGMKWLSDNFSKIASDEKYPRSFPYSTLYAVERIGVASGQKYFNGIDWYEKGANWLIKQQRSDGSFPIDIGSIKIGSPALAILFLTRGAEPLTMNKLDYSAAVVGASTEPATAGKTAAKPKTATPAAATDDSPHWNQRPRDVANLTRWLGRQIERDLNWQVVNLVAPVEELHDAPILYIAGNQELKFTPEHEAKVKQFIEEGGLVLGHADCGTAAFNTSFRQLGSRLFPSYEFAPLPEAHPIYTNQQYPRSKWTRKPQVLSMGNRAREFMILLPDGDPAKAWQMQNPGGKEEQFQVAADIFLYAVDRQSLRRRGESYLVKTNPKITPTKTIKLARLQYSGNWDPEPGGWKRLAAVMNNVSKVKLETTPMKLIAGALAGQTIAHMTGTDAFKLDAIARDEIKQFVNKGGTLIIDAAGGSSAFAIAAEAELTAVFPTATTQLAEVLPPDHAIFTKGEKLPATIGYRNFARSRLGNLKGAQLRAIKVNDRAAVIFSREDLSAGLVGQAVDGIVGYDPETATALMRNILLYASPKGVTPKK